MGFFNYKIAPKSFSSVLMNNLYEVVLIPLLSSSAVLGVFVFFIKRYLDRLINLAFDRRSKLFETKWEQSKKTSGFVLDTELGMYPEIAEIVYRIRNVLLQGIKQSHAYKWDANFPLLCAHLTENLYKYRLFLSDNIFEDLHEFKRIAQDALLICDTFTRSENVADNTEYKKLIAGFQHKVERADELHAMIIQDIKNRITSLGGQSAL